jgi:hypothetical protein
MNNFTGDNENTASQNCSVDQTNPCNPWGYRYPYIGDVPRPPYRITDEPLSPWEPLITIATADATNSLPDLDPPKVDTAYTVRHSLSEQDKADLETMIRRVIKEEVASVVRDVLGDRDEAERRERWCDQW